MAVTSTLGVGGESAARSVRQQLTGGSRDTAGIVFRLLLLTALGLSLAVLATLFIDVFSTGSSVYADRAESFLSGGLRTSAATAGVFQALRGTFWIGIFVVLFSFPIGVASALYLEEYSTKGRFARFLNVNIRNLAGVPSIVYGILGLTLFVQSFEGFTGGRTLMSAGITLAILVLPIVIITAAEAVRAVPQALREAAYGVGATRWEVTRGQVLPYAMPGIITGTVLALARAIGEAAPLLLVGAVTGLLPGKAGLVDVGALTDRFTALPVVIADWARTPRGVRRDRRCRHHPDARHRARHEHRGHPAAEPLREEEEVTAVATDRTITEPTNLDQNLDVTPDVPAHHSQSPREVVFEVSDLDVYYGAFRAVRDVNVEVNRHEITAFIGPSGCGKTTVLRCLNRMNDLIDTARVEGSVRYHGVDLYDREVNAVEVRRRIGMVFQKPNPFPKSIYDNVSYGPKIAGFKGNMDDIVEKALRGAGLWDEVKSRLKASGMGLSGGQQQRLCIARAIATDPEVLLMDEPCSALDPIATARIEDLMQEIKDQFTIVIVTHNMQQAARVSDRTAFFTTEVNPESDTRTGLLVECDSTDKMFSNPSDERTENYVTGRFG